MASTKSLLYQVSTALIVLLFTVSGVMKLTPLISPEVHGEMRSKFYSYARIPPFDLIKLDPDVYRAIVAGTELACVGFILLLEYRLRVLATWVLLVIMVGAIYTHIMVHDTPDKMVGAFIGLGLVLTRLATMGHLRVKID